MGPVQDHFWMGNSQSIFIERFKSMYVQGSYDGGYNRADRFHDESLKKIEDIKNNMDKYQEKKDGFRVAPYTIPRTMKRLIVFKVGYNNGNPVMHIYDVGAIGHP